jgi:peptidylprolyl isomerase
MSNRSALALTALLLVGNCAIAQTPAPVADAPAPADLNTPPADAARTATGLVSRMLQAGDGKTQPKPKDFVTLNFTGWTKDGKQFENTLASGEPISVGLDRLMKGMGEGLQLMSKGEKRRLWIPQALAFNGMKDRPAGDLVMDIHLLDVEPSPAIAPADVAAVPGDALLLPSGLAYKVLRAGKGKEHPTRRDMVTVHYSGWTTDGKLFDSSVLRGNPATFKVSSVIAGWTEALQKMVQGEKTRFWIPEKLAYKGEEGKPAGMLVFDVELQAFWK